MGFFALQYVPKTMRVLWLRQVLSHPCSCCSLGVWDFLSNTFLKSSRQGTCYHRDGSQTHAPQLLLPARRMSAGPGLEAGQPHEPKHCTQGHIPPPAGAKMQQNLGPWSAPGHAPIPLEANCLDWQAKT